MSSVARGGDDVVGIWDDQRHLENKVENFVEIEQTQFYILQIVNQKSSVFADYFIIVKNISLCCDNKNVINIRFKVS